MHQYRGMEFESYFRARRGDHGRVRRPPHWGKRHYQTAATLRAALPGLGPLPAVRERLDPERKFENEYLRRVLGLELGAPFAAVGRDLVHDLAAATIR